MPNFRARGRPVGPGPWAPSETIRFLTKLNQFTSLKLLPQTPSTKQPLRKDQKKVDKLSAQLPYHEGRGNAEEVTKIKGQIEAIWAKAREAAWA